VECGLAQVLARWTVAEQEDDQLLRQRLQQGDPSVLESILRTYGPAIAGWLRHKYAPGLDREEIRDILSDALWKLWKGRERYDPAKSSLRSYFFLLARHQAVDTLKSGWHAARRCEVRLREDVNGLAGKKPAAPANPDRKDADGYARKLRDLMTCMDDLNESSRRVLWEDACSKDDGVPSGILAQELKLSESAVRVARKRGLDKLREAMKKLGY
jgi:RNA polymerase sigma-70 factor (ECF subfamily)